MEWKNEYELQKDLAEYLRQCEFMTFTEVQIPGCENGRVDVVAIKPHVYAIKDLRAYEVKLTKQAFYADVSKNKWYKYMGVFHRIYFAAPEGLLKKSDIPDEAGLIVRNENGWHVVKAPKYHKPERLNEDSVLALLYHGYEESRVMRRLNDRIAAEENIPLSKKARQIGWEISRRLSTERVGEVEEWASDIAKILEESLGIEIKYENNGGLRLPYKYQLEHILKGLGELYKSYSDIKEIGRYLFSLGDKYGEEDKPKILEIVNS